MNQIDVVLHKAVTHSYYLESSVLYTSSNLFEYFITSNLYTRIIERYLITTVHQYSRSSSLDSPFVNISGLVDRNRGFRGTNESGYQVGITWQNRGGTHLR